MTYLSWGAAQPRAETPIALVCRRPSPEYTWGGSIAAWARRWYGRPRDRWEDPWVKVFRPKWWLHVRTMTGRQVAAALVNPTAAWDDGGLHSLFVANLFSAHLGGQWPPCGAPVGLTHTFGTDCAPARRTYASNV